MTSDGLERAEVDRLVQELESRPRAPKPPVAPPATPAGASAAAVATTEHRAPAPGRPWTTARLSMPAAAEPRKTFAFASAMRASTWPRLGFPALSEPRWSVFTARMFVGLGLVQSAAMPYWPYANACSWGLMLYLSAVLLVVVTGVWGMKLTWDARLGAAHTLAICVVFWSLTLVTAEVLPRVGYAQTQEPWFCPW